MRRPLKPFVTEYKGNRRQAPGQQSPSLQPLNPLPPSLQPHSQQAAESAPREFRAFESERSRAKPADFAMREDSEDSYEAAMRAADALFARPTPQPPAADATTAEGADADSSPAGAERGGRILRALDEPPPPQLVALEAAHAPKRRGRKPGSKNKPKPQAAAAASIALAHAASAPGLVCPEVFQDPASVAAPAARADNRTSAMRRLEAIPVADTPQSGSSPQGSSPNELPATVSKRFPWVRDRLKPGEAWKRRRLPRICW